MGFDLKSRSGAEFRYTGTGWTFYLNLAEQYGWVKKGSRKPKGYGLFKKWPGNYDSNENQTVTAEDASNLADALERALADPQLTAKAIELATGLTTAVEQAIGQKMSNPIMSDLDQQSSRDAVRKFIGFCRQGAFDIT